MEYIVYKMEMCIRDRGMIISYEKNPECDDSTKRLTELYHESVHTAVRPVSYTHLDVYKRQGLSSSSRPEGKYKDGAVFLRSFYEECPQQRQYISGTEQYQHSLPDVYKRQK